MRVIEQHSSEKHEGKPVHRYHDSQIESGPPKKEFIADIKWYYNMPALPHDKKVALCASDYREVTDIIHKNYPNVISCKVFETGNDNLI